MKEMTIGEKMQQVEIAMGFKLHEWQKNYIVYGSRALMPAGRQNGRTTAHILRLLLTSAEPIYTGNVAPDEWHGHNYVEWYRREVRKIHEKLVAAGIPVQEIREGRE